jgi:hypothetical protein
MGDTKTAADVAAELQAAVTAEGADAASHEAAINQAISDLQALPEGTGTDMAPATLTGALADGTQVTYSLNS